MLWLPSFSCQPPLPLPPLFPLFPVLFHLHILVTNFVLSTNARPILHTGKAVKQRFSLELEPVQTDARQNRYLQRQCFFSEQRRELALKKQPWALPSTLTGSLATLLCSSKENGKYNSVAIYLTEIFMTCHGILIL